MDRKDKCKQFALAKCLLLLVTRWHPNQLALPQQPNPCLEDLEFSCKFKDPQGLRGSYLQDHLATYLQASQAKLVLVNKVRFNLVRYKV